MPILSIIVPAYNVEDYIHKCIDSILSQSFSDFELIIVNDGLRITPVKFAMNMPQKILG